MYETELYRNKPRYTDVKIVVYVRTYVNVLYFEDCIF